MSKKQKKVAIFDIDGTLFRSSLLIEIVEEMIERELFKPTVRNMYKKSQKEWQDRVGSYDDYINDVVRAFEKNIKGIHYKDFLEVSKTVVEKNKGKVYRYTRDLIADLKKKNYYLLAISQSPKTILDIFCKDYGFDKVYGRIYEMGPTDKLTGKTLELHLIANKANIVKRAAEKENLTLKDSIAVGDTEGDLPMLESVENPICFNPNGKLFKHAKRNKWEIVVERKDVIYLIQ